MTCTPVILQAEEGAEGDESFAGNQTTAEPAIPKVPRVTGRGIGQTVFLRNVLFETTETELRDAFKKFGKIRSVKVVVDAHTQRPRGTAFVEFWAPESAEKAIEESNKGGDYHQSKVLDQASVVSAAIKQGGVYVEGRRLLVSAAVDRNKANELRTTNAESKKHEKTDRRNLYLAAEGVIREGDPAARNLTPAELALRANAERGKAQKLRDPSNFVSKTRLCVRNMPLLCDEVKLKALFLRAIEKRPGSQSSSAGKQITAVKIVRDSATGRTQGGAARSMGYGFVEFAEHDDALFALRALNNNPTAFAELPVPTMQAGGSVSQYAAEVAAHARSSHRLVVEFSVENMKAVQTLERRKQRNLDRQETLQKTVHT